MAERPVRAWPPAQMMEKDAAYHVGASSVSTFRMWVERGTVQAGRKAGKHRLWRRADLDAAVERMHPDAVDDRRTRRISHAYDPAKIQADRRRAALGG